MLTSLYRSMDASPGGANKKPARKKAKVSDSDNSDLFRAMMDAPNVGIGAFTAVRNNNREIIDFRIDFVNKRTLEAFGGNDPTGKRLSDFGADGTEQFRFFKQALETGEKNSYTRKAESGIVEGWFLFSNAPLGGDRVIHVWEDITELKKAEQEVNRLKDKVVQWAADKYYSIFNSIDEGFCIYELIYDGNGQPVDLRWIEVNPAYEKQTGLKNVMGKLHSDLGLDTEKYWLEIYDKVAKTGQAVHFENWHGPTGRWYNTYSSRIGSSGSKQVAVVFSDITERKQLEQRKEFLYKLSDAIRPLSDPVAVQRKAIEVLRTYLGVQRVIFAEAPDKENTMHIIVEDKEPSLSPMAGMELRFPDFTPDVIKKALSGDPLWRADVLRDGYTPEQQAAFTVLGVRAWLMIPLIKEGQLRAELIVLSAVPRKWTPEEIALVVETTERIWTAAEKAKTEEALHYSEERSRIALNSAGMAAWDWDIKTDKVNWNDQHFYLLGLQPGKKEIDAGFFIQFLHPDDRSRISDALQNAINETGIFQQEFRVIRNDNQERWMNGYGKTISRENAKATRMVGVMFDITDRKKLEQQKEDFIAIASHELKTPVTSIKAYAEVLHEMFSESGDTVNAALMEKMDAQIDRLIDLIRALLDTSKLGEGDLKLDMQDFDISELIEERVVDWQRLSAAHPIHTTCSKELFVTGDRERIAQVLTNLVSNAIKYSPGGGRVDIHCQSLNNEVQISVGDEGIGMPPAVQQKVFDRFFRDESVQAKMYPGMGLGLYVAAAIIKQHGGRIWVESIAGKGSTFYFSIPLVK